MRVRRPWLIAVVLLVVPSAAAAHDHTADFFGGFTFASASKLFGMHQTLGLTSPTPSSRNLSAIADLTLHIGSHEGDDLTRVTYLFGARWTFAKESNDQTNLVSIQALAGGIHDGATVGANNPALALGVGYEFLPKGHQSTVGWAFRIQGDYVVTRDDLSFPRVSAGIVYRIKRP